jgi:predicted Rossmann fold flavoprotein
MPTFSITRMDKNPVVVIGAGGAGIIAAWRAASLGARVLLLERKRRIGTKILISGGGRCNITHDGPMEALTSAFPRREARFLKRSFYRFTNRDIIELIEGFGVKTMVRPDGRVFPSSGTARDVVRALEHLLANPLITLRTDATVTAIEGNQGGVTGVRVGEDTLRVSALVLATGGASYPATGTTGDGFRWARMLGHTICPLRPALAPMLLPLPHAWQGVALRGGRLTAKLGGKTVASATGDLLITHDGVSGPAVLELARPAAVALEKGPVILVYDFLPSTSESTLDKDLISTMGQHPAMQIATLIEEKLPNRMIDPLLRSIAINPSTRACVLTREARRGVVALLKRWEIGQVRAIPLERGEVTAGGISLDEVEPSTMASRIVRGLFPCGEVLDIAGPVGGYNLQAAFSTGFVAGESAAAM